MDQFPLWLDALEQVLGSGELDVVGRATGFREALELLRQHRPDLLVGEIHGMDPEIDGSAFLERAQECCPALRVIVFSWAADPAQVADALTAGVSVYVFKTAAPEDLRLAVNQVLEQSIYLANGHKESPTIRPRADSLPALTKRELEILRLVAEGHSNAHLARMLWVTEQTVKFHLSNIYRKLEVANRTEASRWAQVHNLLPPAPTRSSAGA